VSLREGERLPEWLQPVPPGWDVPLLRLVARVESGHTPSRSQPDYWVPEECDIPWFTLADIWQLREGRQKYLGDTKEKVSRAGVAASSARLLPSGTVVLSRTASVGFSGIMAQPMATSQDFVNFVCGPRLSPDFLLWALRGMRPELDRLRRGSTHQTIYMPDVLQFRVPLPPKSTQRGIAGFLDRKTAAIDALIQGKERLLQLLDENRVSLIHRVVTKGLDPSAPMKDSGLPWVGEIPAHWVLQPLKYLTPNDRRIMYGIVLPGPHVNGGVPIVKAGNCVPGKLKLAEMRRTSHEIEGGYAKSRLRAGDIVFSIRGSYGSAEQVPRELEGANLTQDAARIAPRSGVDSRWLWYLANSEAFTGFLEPRVVGATIKGVNIWDLQRVPIPTPPESEQHLLAQELDRRVEDLVSAVNRIAAQVSRLREYRQALITAAVTGQLAIPEAGA